MRTEEDLNLGNENGSKKKPPYGLIFAIIGGFLAFVLLVSTIVYFVQKNSYINSTISMERGLSAQYRDAINTLSSYSAGFTEQAGVAGVSADRFGQIMRDVIEGTIPVETGSGGIGVGSPLFVALARAYPDLSGVTGAYDRIIDYIQKNRAKFAGVQSALQDKVRSYEDHISGSWRSRRWLEGKYPSPRLEAQIGPSDIARGLEALTRMKTIVATADSNRAFQTGVDTPLTIPGRG